VINTIRLVISQKSVRDRASEWDMTPSMLDAFTGRAQKIGERAFAMVAGTEEPEYNPGDDQCFYCPAKLDCPGYAKLVADISLGGFDVLTDTPVAETKTVEVPTEPDLLATYFLKIGLIRKWCDAVEAAALEKAEDGRLGEAHGVKLVDGRKGKRDWTNPEEAEAMLKSMKVPKDQMYDFKVISPTTAEKVLADSPRRWKKAQEIIVQKAGKHELVALSDKRPAVVKAPSCDGLEDASIEDLL